MKLFVCIVALTLIIAPIASVFLLAAFDYTWWAPIEHTSTGLLRLFLLCTFHIGSVFLGVSIGAAADHG